MTYVAGQLPPLTRNPNIGANKIILGFFLESFYDVGRHMKRIGWNENISLRPISDLRFQIDLAGWYSCFKDNRVRLKYC